MIDVSKRWLLLLNHVILYRNALVSIISVRYISIVMLQIDLFEKQFYLIHIYRYTFSFP